MLKLVQVCTEVRPALDEELPSAYVEEFRYAFLSFMARNSLHFVFSKIVDLILGPLVLCFMSGMHVDVRIPSNFTWPKYSTLQELLSLSILIYQSSFYLLQ